MLEEAITIDFGEHRPPRVESDDDLDVASAAASTANVACYESLNAHVVRDCVVRN
jgi:hypothetical protein